MMAAESSRWLVRLDGSSLPDRDLIGGKAWSIACMRAQGLPVPPAFVVTTEACRHYLDGGAVPASLMAEVRAGIEWLQACSGRRFGAGPRPLLVSVRSGAPVSMPGMMDTVLNLGINDHTQALLAAECGDPAFAADTRRRFRELYGSIVMKTEPAEAEIPSDVDEQLNHAIGAVFGSWNSRRARRYRDHHGIRHDMGTAVVVQVMVFGNLDARSGTGVLFSRNPLSGAREPYGEFLSRAQGEDVVSGQHTPAPIHTLRESDPASYAALLAAAQRLEAEAQDVQDIEFTVERGHLYLLQTRVAKRAPRAAARIAVDMVAEGRISVRDALTRLSSLQVRQLLNPRLADGAAAQATIVARGEAASPGIGVGRVVTDSDEAERRAQAGDAVVLACESTNPNDLHGMIAARAILTGRGGSTSHAAVVSRALGRPCIVGCGEAVIEALAGQIVTVDGAAGIAYRDALPVVNPQEDDDPDLRQIATWASQHSAVQVSADGVSSDVFDGPLADCIGRIHALPRGATVAGRLFALDDAAVQAAIAAGVDRIVTRPVLPALLVAAQAALQHATETQ